MLPSIATHDNVTGNPNEEMDAPPQMAESKEDKPSQCRTWVRYRIELRHRVTGELIHRSDSEQPQERELESLDDQPIFELITRYETGGSEVEQAQGALLATSANKDLNSAPSYFLRIYSSAIINALRSVVQYYPSQDLSGSTIDIKWPYPVLVHHYEALHEFKAKCDAKDPNELCTREKDASAHLTRLLSFVDENIMERVKAEQERFKDGFNAFENLWIAYKPGDTVVSKGFDLKWRAVVVSSVTGGIYENSTAPWKVTGWFLEFDGKYLGRKKCEMFLAPFDGIKSWKGVRNFVRDQEHIEGEELEELVSYGEMYYGLLRRQCRHHKGRTVDHPYNEVTWNWFSLRNPCLHANLTLTTTGRLTAWLCPI